jgi:phosphoenolpyruvate carboxylase
MIGKDPTVDIIPLFESVDDLQNAHSIMEQLYTNPEYLSIYKLEEISRL